MKGNLRRKMFYKFVDLNIVNRAAMNLSEHISLPGCDFNCSGHILRDRIKYINWIVVVGR